MGIRVVISDGHHLVRAGIRSILGRETGIDVVGQAADGQTAVEMAKAHAADIIITEIATSHLNGIEVTRRIIDHNLSTRVIVVSSICDGTMVREVLRAGAKGYLLKSSTSAELMLAIRAVRDGTVYLSPRVSQLVVKECLRMIPVDRPSVFSLLTSKQREVLQLLAEGKSNKEVAACLRVTPKTVETHRAQLMETLGIRTIAGLTKYAIRQGITSIEF
jgi:DNA-binding NarL/FixJ family response regulator